MPNSAFLRGRGCSELVMVMRSHSRMSHVLLDLPRMEYESKSKLIDAQYSIELAQINK